MPAAKDPRSGRLDAVVNVRVPVWLKREAERRAAHELVPYADIVRKALEEKFLKDDDK
jgi:hypothetical protein